MSKIRRLVSRRLNELRGEVTQKTLAKRAGVSVYVIGKIESYINADSNNNWDDIMVDLSNSLGTRLHLVDVLTKQYGGLGAGVVIEVHHAIVEFL